MSITKKLSRSEMESIYSAANSAIWHSHFRAGSIAKRKAREEDYVATLITDGVPILADRWISVLAPKGIDLRISGIFCHGHPQVIFGHPRQRVELADLLIVHQHSEKGRNTARAMLIQAKMSIDSTHSLTSNDPQLALFSGWPPFEFVTGGLTPGIRDIKETGKGSRYALVLQDNKYPEQITWADQCPWAASLAKQELAAEHSLAKLLGNMLLAKDGRPVQLTATKDDWSRTIKELLEITGKKTFRRTNISLGQTHRLSEMASFETGTLFSSQSSGFRRNITSRYKSLPSEAFFLETVESQFKEHSGIPPMDEPQRSPEGGISTLLIETRMGDE